jgi:hypothetical protein
MKRIEGLLQEIGSMKLYDLGKRETVKPFSWSVQIKYYEIADSELAEQFSRILNKALWSTTIVKSADDHVPQVDNDKPRVHFIAAEVSNRETAIRALSILNEAQFIKEPGGVVLGTKPSSMSPLSPASSITPDFYLEILPRRRN